MVIHSYVTLYSIVTPFQTNAYRMTGYILMVSYREALCLHAYGTEIWVVYLEALKEGGSGADSLPSRWRDLDLGSALDKHPERAA